MFEWKALENVFVQDGVGTSDAMMNDLQALLNSASPGGVEAVLTGHAHQLPKMPTYFDSIGHIQLKLNFSS